MNIRSLAAVSVCVALLTACAATPDSIAPAYVSELGYRDLNCDQLILERQRVAAAYTRVEAQQNQARTNDVVGVLLIGLPVSSLSGQNVAAQVADLKGQRDALDRVMIARSCDLGTPAPAAEGTTAT